MWHDGGHDGTVSIFPFTFRVAQAMDDQSLQGLAYGPVAMIAKAGG